MQLILLLVAAFGLGYWFSRSNGGQRLTQAVKNASNRFRRNPPADATKTAVTQVEAETAPETP